jgi:hypothetical protein
MAWAMDWWHQLAGWQQLSLVFLSCVLLGLYVAIDPRQKAPGVYLIRRKQTKDRNR